MSRTPLGDATLRLCNRAHLEMVGSAWWVDDMGAPRAHHVTVRIVAPRPDIPEVELAPVANVASRHLLGHPERPGISLLLVSHPSGVTLDHA